MRLIWLLLTLVWTPCNCAHATTVERQPPPQLFGNFYLYDQTNTHMVYYPASYADVLPIPNVLVYNEFGDVFQAQCTLSEYVWDIPNSAQSEQFYLVEVFSPLIGERESLIFPMKGQGTASVVFPVDGSTFGMEIVPLDRIEENFKITYETYFSDSREVPGFIMRNQPTSNSSFTVQVETSGTSFTTTYPFPEVVGAMYWGLEDEDEFGHFISENIPSTATVSFASEMMDGFSFEATGQIGKQYTVLPVFSPVEGSSFDVYPSHLRIPRMMDIPAKFRAHLYVEELLARSLLIGPPGRELDQNDDTIVDCADLVAALRGEP